jgi:hypothetical protein
MSLTPKKTVTVESKWPMKSIEYFLQDIKWDTTKIQQNEIQDTGSMPVITQEQDRLVAWYCQSKNSITDLPLIVFGDHSCTIKYVDFPFVRWADGTQLLKTDPQQLLPKYVYHYLWFVEIPNKDKYERHFKYLKSLKIPLPPLDIQAQIVQACEQIDVQVSTAQAQITQARARIGELVDEVVGRWYEMKKLGDIADIINWWTPSTTNSEYRDWWTICRATLVDTKNKYLTDTQRKITQKWVDNSSAKVLPIKTVIFSSRATIWEVTIAKVETATNQWYKNFICKNVIHEEYLYYLLKKEWPMIASKATWTTFKEVNTETIKNYQIPVPPIAIQTALVAQITEQEIIITTAQTIIDQSPHSKQAVMRQWL